MSNVAICHIFIAVNFTFDNVKDFGDSFKNSISEESGLSCKVNLAFSHNPSQDAVRVKKIHKIFHFYGRFN